MPVFVDSPNFDAPLPGRKTPTRFLQGSGKCITLGLVNNMPDEALKATERQFVSLLDSASAGIQIRLMRYMLPDVPRQEPARRYLNSAYASVDDLWNAHLDGLIVTGREPLAINLKQEPYWESFTRLADWAESNTHSTVWSCLAAHAAILHMDGIVRVRRNEKLFGIFECARAVDHRLTAASPSRFRLPHSRWNGAPEEDLTACGYSVLTRAGDAGVDTFIKQRKKLFVFFQGHPEYEPDTLLREYRRDIGRYFKRETEHCPLIPHRYFDDDTVHALTALRERSLCDRSEELLLEILTALGERKIEKTWDSSATNIYRNWLEYICAQKEMARRSKRIKVIANAHRILDETAAVLSTVAGIAKRRVPQP
jgi:homoserine O-succinyltransferase/O-acetyltransferase